jgi:hypothetical protein
LPHSSQAIRRYAGLALEKRACAGIADAGLICIPARPETDQKDVPPEKRNACVWS